MKFQILGPLTITGSDGTEIALSSAKQRALLTLLLVNRGQVLSADRIIDELWEDEAPSGGVKTLQFHLSKLRDVLEPGRARGSDGTVISTRQAGYVLDTTHHLVDAADFDREVIEATTVAEADPPMARDLLLSALSRWNGRALDDVAYLSFAQIEAQRLEEVRMQAVETRIEIDMSLGRDAELVAELETLTSQNPLRERLWGQLMLALYRSDRQAEALRVYQVAHRTLGEELGLEPSAALRQLEDQMLRQDLSLAAPTTSAGRPQTNLPAAVSSFVGRDTDTAAVAELLQQNRLVTLTGVGGVGKTRLAQHVANSMLENYPDGVWLVEFGPVSDPSSVPEAITTALGVRPSYGRPAMESAVEHVQSTAVLLILDNCEHVIDAAAAAVDAVLAGSLEVRVLATSREPLRVPGEMTWPVEPMVADPTTTIDLESPPDAVRLFVARAVAADPTFVLTAANATTVMSICHRLDGLPLAIELAAAPMRALRVEDIASGLKDRFAVLAGGSRSALAHQRTLEATVGWSFDLLDSDEQTLFTALGVFAGSFERTAAEQVAVGAGTEPHAVLRLLVNLVDKSLLSVVREDDEIKYRMLATVSHYARLKLASHPAARQIADAHSNWAISIAEAASSAVTTIGDSAWLARIHSARDDLEIVLERAREQGTPEVGMRLLVALQMFFVEAGDHGGFLSANAVRDEASWVDRLLAAGEVSPDILGAVLSAQGYLLILQGDLEGAIPILERCLELCKSTDDRVGRARAQLFLATALW